jgi:ABC-type polar amino acid transport system ATPase subunit
MDEGQIIEEAPPKAFFEHAQHPRTQAFLKRLLA